MADQDPTQDHAQDPAQVQHATAATAVADKPTRAESKPLSMWNVVLLDDDHHTYEYVMEMGTRLFGMNEQQAYLTAQRVDADGRVICMTTHKEHAELKRDQIHGFGKDAQIAGCAGSMSAVIEPA